MNKIRPEHIAMLLRGLFWQILHLRFSAVVLKGRGARIWIDRRVRLHGIVKVGDYAKLDLRFCGSGVIGPMFSLGDFSVMRASGSPSFTCPFVQTGSDVSFGPYCNIGGGFGLIIGDGVIAGPYVSIHPEEHGLELGQAVRGQPVRGVGIRIGRDCWLGAKSTILDGSDLSDGTAVGAGAIVTGPTEPNGIYVGTPARLLRRRQPTAPEVSTRP